MGILTDPVNRKKLADASNAFIRIGASVGTVLRVSDTARVSVRFSATQKSGIELVRGSV